MNILLMVHLCAAGIVTGATVWVVGGLVLRRPMQRTARVMLGGLGVTFLSGLGLVVVSPVSFGHFCATMLCLSSVVFAVAHRHHALSVSVASVSH